MILKHPADFAFHHKSPYTRSEAAYAVPSLRHRKFWPTVSRVDDSYGDKNLVCECGTVDEYSTDGITSVEVA